jgi:hypothetical protein
MAQSFPASVIASLKASGGPAPVSLLDLQSLSGTLYYWSDANITVQPVLSDIGTPGGGIHPLIVTSAAAGQVAYKPWILKPPSFHTYKSTQTASGVVTIQNVSGNTVQRDVSQIFTRQEMIGCLAYFRIWKVDMGYPLFAFQGKVNDVDIDADGESMTLSIEGFCNWSKIAAPDQQIGVSCPLMFGSVACGSASATPCQNNYGTCTSVERFKGVVLEWNGGSPSYTQYVQPAPLTLFNGRIQG